MGSLYDTALTAEEAYWPAADWPDTADTPETTHTFWPITPVVGAFARNGHALRVIFHQLSD
jgi:hypothetical protein